MTKKEKRSVLKIALKPFIRKTPTISQEETLNAVLDFIFLVMDTPDDDDSCISDKVEDL